jgi:hypothetical protein
MEKLKKYIFKICPKSKKVVGFNFKSRLLWMLFPIIGLLALIWFLVRVIPKPSRASYPCQQAAAPIAASFVLWIAGGLGSAVFFKKAYKKLQKSKYASAGVLAVLGLVVTLTWAFNTFPISSSAYSFKDMPNQPIGEGRGVFPGRVSWIHDPASTSFNLNGNWWEDAYNDQTALDAMVSSAIKNLSGKVDDTASWDTLFKNFNQRNGKPNIGYQPGEKIAIKINQNNTTSHASNNQINASPQLILSLLKSLVNTAGVSQGNITVFDSSRFITDNIYTKCHAIFPNVIFVDNIGGDGRVKSTYVNNDIPFSISNGNQATGICSSAVNANYVIDMALLKGHAGQGVTLCGKNFFGATSINSNFMLNSHNNFDSPSNGTPKYMTFTDFLGHKDLGEKTVLYMIDALYANDVVAGAPHLKWKTSPFNNDWPSSIFVSQDGVAIDSVGIDFLKTEFTNLADMNYCDTYLHEAAKADNPESKVVYDPERDGTRCKSLGTHEHWNNAADKKYSRNLGTGNGIDLIYINPSLNPIIVYGDVNDDGKVDALDLALLKGYLLNTASIPHENGVKAADVNQDNSVDATDLAILKAYLLGTIKSLPTKGI